MSNSQASTAKKEKSVAVRVLLTRALRKNGFKKTCKDEPADFTKGSERASQIFVGAMFMSLVLYAVNHLKWAFYPTLFVVVGSLLLSIVVTVVLKIDSAPVAYLYFALSLSALGYLLITGQGRVAWITHVLPLGLFVAGRWSLRAVAGAARFPLFVPLSIIVVLAPLLTEDPWRLAAAAGWQLVWLVVVATTPLLFLLIRRIARVSVEATLRRAAEQIAFDPDAAGRDAAEIVAGRLSNGEKSELDGLPERFAASYTEKSLASMQSELLESGSRRFKRNAINNFLTIALGVALLTFLLVYVLAWAGMPESLAREWSRVEVPTQFVDFLFFSVAFPLGPYVAVAVLFSAISTAGFLSFALTEEQHADALHGAVTTQRARVYLTLAIPWARLRDGGRLTKSAQVSTIPAARNSDEQAVGSTKNGSSKPRKNRRR